MRVAGDAVCELEACDTGYDMLIGWVMFGEDAGLQAKGGVYVDPGVVLVCYGAEGS